MTKGEMTDLMVQALSEGHLFQGSRLLRLVHRLLPLGKAFGTIPQINFELFCALAERVGTIKKLDRIHQRCTLLVNAGFFDMNPALVLAVYQGGTVYLAAHASEGLIPQGTAGKAIRKLAEACQSFQ